jgi:lysophospholipase L1-like esterase
MKLHVDQRCDAVRNKPECKCADPTQPDEGKPFMIRQWRETHKRNIRLVEPLLQAAPELDVLLLGDSITEHWIGTDLGYENPEFEECQQIYQQLFLDNPNVRGLALGIGGDRCPQLLYRLQNGEFPPELQVPIVWINIGTNDIGGDYCNANAIVAGNIGIVQEVLSRPHVRRIVINSIVPRGNPTLARDRTWQILRRVNQRLQCYAESQDARVEFFNSTDLFLNGTDCNTTLYHDDIHPSAEGYRVWGSAIVQRVQEIRAELAKEPPVPAATKNPTAAPVAYPTPAPPPVVAPTPPPPLLPIPP